MRDYLKECLSQAGKDNEEVEASDTEWSDTQVQLWVESEHSQDEYKSLFGVEN